MGARIFAIIRNWKQTDTEVTQNNSFANTFKESDVFLRFLFMHAETINLPMQSYLLKLQKELDENFVP